MVYTSQKISFHYQESGYFSKIGFTVTEKKCPNKIILFQVERKLVSTGRNGEFVLEYVFNRRKNCLHWQKCLENYRKSLQIAVMRVRNRLLYNLNNGFH